MEAIYRVVACEKLKDEDLFVLYFMEVNKANSYKLNDVESYMKYADAKVPLTSSLLEHLRQVIVRAQEDWGKAETRWKE